jgi:hypothetical protein
MEKELRSTDKKEKKEKEKLQKKYMLSCVA